MSVVTRLYGSRLALLTDLYQLTMACAHWNNGSDRREAVFHLSLRSAPFGAPVAIAAGLDAVLDYLEQFAFAEDDLDYLATLRDAAGQPLFPREFLSHLSGLRLDCDVDAVPEGTAVPAFVPLLRVRGPLLQAQMLETALLNLLGYPTLIASKAARIAHAAGDTAVVDFGLRKAHGVDGGVTAARAAYLGGCAATATVLAGKLFGIPVRGTHAHGWVMSFDAEPEAFDAYARALPDNCIFLVDTYDTLTGIHNAIAAGRKLRAAGHEMIGIRLDSGDLGEFSVTARRMLDEAGFPDARIVASSDLDEDAIAKLRRRGAPIAIWGVGTHLATAQPDGMLNAIYKLSAVRGDDGSWRNRVKLSDTPAKHSLPGVQQTRRYWRDGRPQMDVIYDQGTTGADLAGARRVDDGSAVALPQDADHEDLLVPVARNGRRCLDLPALDSARDRAKRQYAAFVDCAAYPVLLEDRLYAERGRLQEAVKRYRKG